MTEEKNGAVAPKKTIFWIMQYSSPFKDVYKIFKKKLSRDYQFIDPLQNKNQTAILAKIIPQIIAADFVIADVSTIGYDIDDDKRPLYNGNVMFELGVAMSYRKKLIMISSASRKGLPFDISGYHVNDYVEVNIDQFIKEIKTILDNLETVYSNPVSDYDNIYDIITKSELDALKTASASISGIASQSVNPPEPPLSEYEVAILKYAIKDFDGVFVTRKRRGKFWITSLDRNRVEILNENGNGETNAGYIFAVDNLVEQRKYVKVDRFIDDYSCHYRLLPSGREVAERLLKEETAESSLES